MTTIPVPLLAFIILIVSSIPFWILLLTWLVMKIVGSVSSRRMNNHLKKHEKELEKTISKVNEK